MLKTWLAIALDNEANTMSDAGQAKAARPLLEQAAALFRENQSGSTPAADRAFEREARSEVLWDLARVLRALGMSNEANQIDAERLGLWSTRSPDELVDLAFKETSRALVIGYGRTDVSDQAKVVRNLDLDQVAANLRLAIERGFKEADRLKAHPDASFVLSRGDLKTAIARLETGRSPKSPQEAQSQGKR